jgi:isocitrate lyase
MKSMIVAGAAGVHFEDQLSSEKNCGHMGGEVLIPVAQHVRSLVAARLTADVCDVPTLVITRTNSLGANLLTSDIDERDHPFLTGDRTPEGFHRITPGEGTPIVEPLLMRVSSLVGEAKPRRTLPG